MHVVQDRQDRRLRCEVPQPARPVPAKAAAAAAPGPEATRGRPRRGGTGWPGRQATPRTRPRSGDPTAPGAAGQWPLPTARTRQSRRAGEHGRTCRPRPGWRASSSRPSLLLPTPASPSSKTTRNSPAAARANSSSSAAISSRRPTSRGLALGISLILALPPEQIKAACSGQRELSCNDPALPMSRTPGKGSESFIAGTDRSPRAALPGDLSDRLQGPRGNGSRRHPSPRCLPHLSSSRPLCLPSQSLCDAGLRSATT